MKKKKREIEHTALDRASAANLGVTVFTAWARDGSDDGSERGNGEESEFGEHG